MEDDKRIMEEVETQVLTKECKLFQDMVTYLEGKDVFDEETIVKFLTEIDSLIIEIEESASTIDVKEFKEFCDEELLKLKGLKFSFSFTVLKKGFSD